MSLRTLVYKRTHVGDPDASGCFGVEDCMGTVRGFSFDAVIGIGGIGAYAQSQGIDGKVNWIGIGPKKTELAGHRGPLVTFEHFELYEAEGAELRAIAPNLARRMYDRNTRRMIEGFTVPEKFEIERLLRMAAQAPPSKGRKSGKRVQCGRKRRRTC